MSNQLQALLALLLLSIVGVCTFLFYFLRGYIARERIRERQRVEQEYALRFSQWQQEALSKTSSKAVNASRSTIKGQIAEQLIPLLKTCPYEPSDMRFFGMPIDYIIFEGMTEARDGEGSEVAVVFMDVKTGNAALSQTQRRIRDAVEAGRVRWETYRL